MWWHVGGTQELPSGANTAAGSNDGFDHPVPNGPDRATRGGYRPGRGRRRRRGGTGGLDDRRVVPGSHGGRRGGDRRTRPRREHGFRHWPPPVTMPAPDRGDATAMVRGPVRPGP